MQQIKIVSLDVTKEKSDLGKRLNQISKSISDYDPDIVCLQGLHYCSDMFDVIELSPRLIADMIAHETGMTVLNLNHHNQSKESEWSCTLYKKQKNMVHGFGDSAFWLENATSTAMSKEPYDNSGRVVLVDSFRIGNESMVLYNVHMASEDGVPVVINQTIPNNTNSNIIVLGNFADSKQKNFYANGFKNWEVKHDTDDMGFILLNLTK